MIRSSLPFQILLYLAALSACDSAKESRTGGASKTAADSAPRKHAKERGEAEAAKAESAKPEPSKAEPTKAEPTKAEPTKAEPDRAAPLTEPCLVTVSIEDGPTTTKPIKAAKVIEMPTGDDAIHAMIAAVLDGEPTAPAPLTRAAVLELGREFGGSHQFTNIEFESGDSAAYTFDRAGRMVQIEFDPTAETRYAIFAYHYECDEALVDAASAVDAGTAAPPQGTPPDWRAVEGDPTGMEASGTFFVPKAWVLEGKVPNQLARPSAASGVHCFLNMPRELTGRDAKAQLTKSAKRDAKKHAVTTTTVERDGTALYVLEYAAQGDGTQIIEAWSLDDTVPMGVTCADESAGEFKGVRKDVDLIMGSFIPFAGERG